MVMSLYSLLWHLLLPAVWLRLYWRGRKQPGYRQHQAERFGRYAQHAKEPMIWLHAVSVGETRAAAPLVKALQRDYPTHRLLLTVMTPTGRETAQQLFGDSVELVYLPYDLPWATRRFLQHFRPALGLIMETELWPNLIAAARRENMPLLLVNARLSERSYRGYRRIAALIRPALQNLTAIAAQTAADAERLRQLGAREIAICGNVIFDIAPPEAQIALGQQFRQGFATRQVILTASTREGEEALLLAAAPKPWPADWLWLLVPRHPQRFDEVAAMAEAAGLAVQRRSQTLTPAADTAIWLGDSMGEMFAYYTACDLALIGGSLLPFGAQNLIEAAACGKPVLIGPHTFNFAEASARALEAGVAETVADAQAFWQLVASLLPDTETLSARGTAGLQFCQQHRGATERILALVHRWLPRG